MEADVVIVGAGLSGLSAGVRLSHFGRRVVVFERQAQPGGLNTYYRRGGSLVDVGLHALTNFSSEGERSAPINKLLRQLRLKRSQWDLCPQGYSLISFPHHELRLDNDFGHFKEEVRREFPAHYDAFLEFCRFLESGDAMSLETKTEAVSARQVLVSYFGDGALAEMLLCPVMFYGNPCIDDMSLRQFAIIFQSVFQEGMGRPRGGIKALLDSLVSQLADQGGVLRLKEGVRRIVCEKGRALGVETDGGEFCQASCVLSCAGAAETAALCTEEQPVLEACGKGQMGFLEIIYKLERPPADYGLGFCIDFVSGRDAFVFRPPVEATDLESMVLCAPGNYEGCGQVDGACTLRVTCLASPERWLAYAPQEYAAAKASAAQFGWQRVKERFPGLPEAPVSFEMFTPKTIMRYTGHVNGAIYGAPVKNLQGVTDCENLFLCGSDQGFLGIIGAMMSGVMIANLRCLY